jgi:hypothetical protein
MNWLTERAPNSLSMHRGPRTSSRCRRGSGGRGTGELPDASPCVTYIPVSTEGQGWCICLAASLIIPENGTMMPSRCGVKWLINPLGTPFPSFISSYPTCRFSLFVSLSLSCELDTLPAVAGSLLLAGCGKLCGYARTSMVRTRGTREEYSRRMLKKAVQQGRSERRGEAYASVR